MRNAFSFLGVEPINIDPNNVKKSVEEDDIHYGIFGKHSVRQIVSKV